MESVLVPTMPPRRTFSHADPDFALALKQSVEDVPLICPHGHVDPALFASDDYSWGTPVDLLIIPDHYIFRMLYSQGVPLEVLGISRRDGGAIEVDHRKIWQTFAEHFYLFRGTPSGLWLKHELKQVFGIDQPLSGLNAQAIYDVIQDALKRTEFSPRRLFERFNIEILATTDAATDDLRHHQAMRDSGWAGQVIPTFRPDALIALDAAGWRDNLDTLSAISGIDVTDYPGFIRALEDRRTFFRSMGAKATDHGALTPYTGHLSEREAETLFRHALHGEATAEEAARFSGHMLIEMARMSIEDGLVMQLHVGAYRNHNAPLMTQFGTDKGADIPLQTEFTRNLKPLLDRHGSDARLCLILFTLDESTYSRELAPLAGHYPALLLGPPWWFHDSPNGMRRYFDQVMETAGLYNTAGFNDDTRAFPSIPARHDLWRTVSAEWLAGLFARGQIYEDEALAMMHDLAYGLAKRAYRLDG